MAMSPEILKAMQALKQRYSQTQGAPGDQTEQGKMALQQKLQGIQDSRGMLGQFSRGNNIYNGTAPQAQMGGGTQFGPPVGNQNAAGAPQPMQADNSPQMQQQMMQQAMLARQNMGQQRSGAVQGPGGGQAAGPANPFDNLRKAADTAKSVLQAHHMTDAANQMKQKRNIDMRSALQRRMQAKQVQDSSIRM